MGIYLDNYNKLTKMVQSLKFMKDFKFFECQLYFFGMQDNNFLRAFIQVTKKAQEERDNIRIDELESQLKERQEKYNKLARQYEHMKRMFESQCRQLRMENIKLESQNHTLKARNEMLQAIVKESQQKSSQTNSTELATFRIINEENRQLKQLIKKYVNQKSDFASF